MDSQNRRNRSSLELNNEQVQQNTAYHFNKKFYKFLLILQSIILVCISTSAIVLYSLEHTETCDIKASLTIWMIGIISFGIYSIIFDIVVYVKYIKPDIPYTKPTKILKRINSFINLILLILSIVLLTNTDDCEKGMTGMYNVLFAYIIINSILIGIPLLFGILLLVSLPFLLRMAENIPTTEGIDQNTLNSTPKGVYENGKIVQNGVRYDIDFEDNACCICMDIYIANVSIRRLNCTHHFHQECIDRWLKINKTCPICRRHVNNVHV